MKKSIIIYLIAILSIVSCEKKKEQTNSADAPISAINDTNIIELKSPQQAYNDAIKVGNEISSEINNRDFSYELRYDSDVIPYVVFKYKNSFEKPITAIQFSILRKSYTSPLGQNSLLEQSSTFTNTINKKIYIKPGEKYSGKINSIELGRDGFSEIRISKIIFSDGTYN